jgi:hypothetical protein
VRLAQAPLPSKKPPNTSKCDYPKRRLLYLFIFPWDGKPARIYFYGSIIFQLDTQLKINRLAGDPCRGIFGWRK